MTEFNIGVKHCRSKRKFPTTVTKGNGNIKGTINYGSQKALDDIKSKYGRDLEVVRTNHNKFQWVFYTRRNKHANK